MKWVYWYEDRGDGWHTVRLAYYKQMTDENGKRIGRKMEATYDEWKANQ